MTRLPDIRGDGAFLLRPQTWQALQAAIQERTPLPGPGSTLDQHPGGYRWRPMPASARDLPLWPRAVGQELRVRPGLVAGLMPSMGGVPLDSTPAPSLPLPSHDVWVMLDLFADLEWADQGLLSADITQIHIRLQPVTGGTGPGGAPVWAWPPPLGLIETGSPPFHLALARVRDRQVLWFENTADRFAFRDATITTPDPETEEPVYTRRAQLVFGRGVPTDVGGPPDAP